MSNYKVINPYFEGSMNTSFSGSDAKEAAENAWLAMSKFMTNNVPKFAFSLENLNDGSVHHLVVKKHYPEMMQNIISLK